MSTENNSKTIELSTTIKGLAYRLSQTAQILSMETSESSSTSTSRKTKTTKNQKLKIFDCRKIPKISFKKFLKRFQKVGNITEEVFITAFVLLKRALEMEDFTQANCIHKLLISSIFTSYKFLHDSQHWFLEEFSKLAGVRKQELELLEICFVEEVLNFRIFVSEKEFLSAKRCLELYATLEN